jgi:hypothetical protein
VPLKRLEGGRADGASARAGIEPDQNEARHMPPGIAPGRVAFLYFAVPPGAPDQFRGFAASEPPIPAGPLVRQRYTDDTVTFPFLAMKIDRRAQDD